MFFYEVLISSNKYHGDDALTYSFPEKLRVGQLVLVPLGATKSMGIVVKSVVKPRYKTKEIYTVYQDLVLADTSLRLLVWIVGYYPSPLYSVVSSFIPNQIPINIKKPNARLSVKTNGDLSTLPKLTQDQTSVVSSIKQDGKHDSYFIHGDTGTGKTMIYIYIILDTLDSGKSCIVLTPEISLTSQLLAELAKYISNPIYVIHSNLTTSQRRNIWIELNNSEGPVVVIGPRSALFSPLANLGLVVIDESHEGTYKQEQFPKYNAVMVGAFLAKLHNAKLIMGTATPNISDYYYFKSKGLPIFRLKDQAISKNNNTKIKVVNIRDRTLFSKHSYISDTLIQSIHNNLKNSKQSLIFLNKRGTARLISCDNCGWVHICPNCEIPLTLHLDNQMVRCHTCGFHERLKYSCPECKSSDISFKSIGSKAIFESIKSLFPDANVRRFDSDNLKIEKLENNYSEVHSGKVDILIGTQILAKGLDLPKLTLVGIISADSNLSFPDYRSEENNYQLLTQIIGRVGRGHNDGSVIIQTLNPDSVSLNSAIAKDWDKFYTEQLAQRKDFNLPPNCYILKIIIQRKTMKSIQQLSRSIIERIDRLNLKIELIGPNPRFNERAMANFNWQIIIKSKNRKNLIEIIHSLPANINYDLDPLNLL